MPLTMQLNLIMMSKYSKFGVDTFYTFWGYTLKFLHDNDNLAITIAFLQNRQAKKKKYY